MTRSRELTKPRNMCIMESYFIKIKLTHMHYAYAFKKMPIFKQS